MHHKIQQWLSAVGFWVTVVWALVCLFFLISFPVSADSRQWECRIMKWCGNILQKKWVWTTMLLCSASVLSVKSHFQPPKFWPKDNLNTRFRLCSPCPICSAVQLLWAWKNSNSCSAAAYNSDCSSFSLFGDGVKKIKRVLGILLPLPLFSKCSMQVMNVPNSSAFAVCW